MEIAILGESDIRAKPADLPDRVSPHQQAGRPKAAKGLCKQFRCSTFDSDCLLIVSSGKFKADPVQA